MKQSLRLARIEQECARIRRPPKLRSNSRPVLRPVNSCPSDEYIKDVSVVEERFDWLKRGQSEEVFCSVCVIRMDGAPPSLTRYSRTESRWQLLSPRGRSVVPSIESHSFSSLHAWALAVHNSTAS